MQLTEEFIQQVQPPTPGENGSCRQAFYRDSILTGFALRVSSGGTKSYILERRIRGRVKRITLGNCNKLSFTRAQARAKKLIREVERENVPRIINGTIADPNISLQDAYQYYLTHNQALSQLTLNDYQRSMNSVLKEWQTTPIRQLTADMIINKHKSYAENSPARCNNAMRLLRAIMNHTRLHLITRDHTPILTKNPVDILGRKKLWHPVTQHVPQQISGTQIIKAWWQASTQLKKVSTRQYLQFLLLTGLPPAMVSQLRFSDLNYERQTLRFANQAYPVPRQICNDLQKLSLGNENNYIFPGLSKDKPISDPRTAISKIDKITGCHVSLRDLHSIFISLVQQAGFAENKVKLLNKLYRKKPVRLSEQEIDLVRTIQERVFLTVLFLVGSIT